MVKKIIVLQLYFGNYRVFDHATDVKIFFQMLFTFFVQCVIMSLSHKLNNRL